MINLERMPVYNQNKSTKNNQLLRLFQRNHPSSFAIFESSSLIAHLLRSVVFFCFLVHSFFSTSFLIGHDLLEK